MSDFKVFFACDEAGNCSVDPESLDVAAGDTVHLGADSRVRVAVATAFNGVSASVELSPKQPKALKVRRRRARLRFRAKRVAEAGGGDAEMIIDDD